MKKLILLLLIMMSATLASAVEFRSVGSNAEFNVYTFDGKYYLILTFKDDGINRLTNHTTVKIVLTDGTIIRLDGINASSSTDMNSTSFYNGFGSSFTIGGSDDKHYAIFPITEEQIESLNIGVERVAINTIPEVYKRSKWSGKKNFGQNLYNDFKNLRDELTDDPTY